MEATLEREEMLKKFLEEEQSLKSDWEVINQALTDYRAKYIAAVQDFLIRTDLDGKVRRKKDGVIGVLDVEPYMTNISRPCQIAFRKITKSGETALNASFRYYIWGFNNVFSAILNEYEPAKE